MEKPTKSLKFYFIVLLFVTFLGLVIFSLRNNSKLLETNPKQEIKYYRVAGIDDGDTITLETGDTIRYLGIDAPEHIIRLLVKNVVERKRQNIAKN